VKASRLILFYRSAGKLASNRYRCAPRGRRMVGPDTRRRDHWSRGAVLHRSAQPQGPSGGWRRDRRRALTSSRSLPATAPMSPPQIKIKRVKPNKERTATTHRPRLRPDVSRRDVGNRGGHRAAGQQGRRRLPGFSDWQPRSTRGVSNGVVSAPVHIGVELGVQITQHIALSALSDVFRSIPATPPPTRQASRRGVRKASWRGGRDAALSLSVSRWIVSSLPSS